MSDLQQILAGTSLTVTETFQIDGAPVNVDAVLPTLALYRPDGTAYTPLPTVLDTWAGPPARSTGQYRFVLPAQATPYKLRYRLTGTIGGQPQTFTGWVEWIGASLFTLADFRALRVATGTPFATTATPLFTNQQIMDERAAVLDELEQILRFSPVPRYALEVHDGGDVIRLDHRYATDLLGVTVSGATSAVGGYYLTRSGVLRTRSGYLPTTPTTSGLGNVAVEYVHGLPRIPGKGSHAAMIWAAQDLNPSAFSSASTVTMPDGSSYTYEPSEMGRGGFERHTGVRVLDRWLNRWSDAQAGVGVA